LLGTVLAILLRMEGGLDDQRHASFVPISRRLAVSKSLKICSIVHFLLSIHVSMFLLSGFKLMGVE
jgi:hypothetical protein